MFKIGGKYDLKLVNFACFWGLFQALNLLTFYRVSGLETFKLGLELVRDLLKRNFMVGTFRGRRERGEGYCQI